MAVFGWDLGSSGLFSASPGAFLHQELLGQTCGAGYLFMNVLSAIKSFAIAQ